MPERCRVLVIGAGAAGTLAAVAGARAGAQTVLVEQDHRPGGLGTTQFHRYICGWFASQTEEPGENLHGPLVRELQDRLLSRAPSTHPARLGKVWAWPLDPEQWSETLSQWIDGTEALRFFPRQRVMAYSPAATSGAGTVVTRGDAGELEFSAEVIVDASGQALVATLAGWPVEEPPAHERQLAGCTLRLTGVDVSDPLLPLKVPHCLNRACRRGLLPSAVRFTTFIPAGDRFSLLRLNLPVASGPELAHKLAQEVFALLREQCAAFRQAAVDSTAALQARDGPRIRGRYRLQAEDVRAARGFDDAVARGAWPMERWSVDRGPVYDFAPSGACYDIPLRCLLSPASDLVLFAGRCVSADALAFGSLRAMGTCMAIGEAAGREAARRAS